MERQRVLLVEDTIVRSTTLHCLLQEIRDRGGAREVHVRIACPPIMPTDTAATKSVTGNGAATLPSLYSFSIRSREITSMSRNSTMSAYILATPANCSTGSRPERCRASICASASRASSSACSAITRWSVVRYGSHSQPFSRSVWIAVPGGGASFTTSETGTAALGNTGLGIDLFAVENATLKNNVISGNEAARGGGLYVEHSSAELVANTNASYSQLPLAPGVRRTINRYRFPLTLNTIRSPTRSALG